ncbi:F0F1 ATP synthase subunit delta [Mycoplasma miroungirhinis]|uniref:ATP synthase subunit delta n=1 Tax=Mycoplasma miroungirhinis TaxID=754516 RepID=A0A6M4JDT9_9MOLU|nr:F0F1 ATP synthase subunit delta [Mycoplasma miroungirhinis]QJR44247.1 F0F1 ATP synthase subunit delta [Mycoplasma miroungirhinis]
MNNEVIYNYGLAMFELAKEENQIDIFYDQLNDIEKSLEEEQGFLKVLNSYSLDNEIKYKLIDEVFGDFNQQIINFLKVSSKNHVVNKIINIINAYKAIYYDTKKIKIGYIYTSQSISLEQINELQKAYSHKYQINLKLKNRIDPKLLGGIKIVIDDIVVDNTILNQIEKLKESILND